MIEDIKKEIEVNIRYFDKEFYDLYNEFCDCAGNGYPQNGRIPIITINKVFEILDKYKDKENPYKKAWEELREDNQLPIPFIELLSELMQNLEEKYGIGVE